MKNVNTYLCGVPAFAGQLAALRVIDGRVQDGDTQVAILVHVRMPDLGEEADGRRGVGVIRREFDVCLQPRKRE